MKVDLTKYKDVEVELRFVPTEQGGRRTPVASGYRPQFYRDGVNFDAVHTYIGVEQVFPGQTVRAFLSFIHPDLQVGHLHPGTEFEIREGQRVVATGYVIRIVDLEKPCRVDRAKRIHHPIGEFSSMLGAP